jgi:NADH dehydrogenase/NADH:ubiquinone oxidoreductase subunit G
VDLTDSTGTAIYVATKETEIVRILPKKDNTLNNSFISDKTRFSFDAAHTLRLNNLFVKKKS